MNQTNQGKGQGLTGICWAAGMGPQVKAMGPRVSPINETIDPQGIWALVTSRPILATVPMKAAVASIWA